LKPLVNCGLANQLFGIKREKDLETRWDKVKSVEGIEIIETPSLVEYPRAGGGQNCGIKYQMIVMQEWILA